MSMTGLAPQDDTISDFTSQISGKLGPPIVTGSFGKVYRCTIESSVGKTEVAVKVFEFNPGENAEKIRKGIRRELRVWLRLKRPTIVPLLGIAYVDGPFPALVSQWMSSGTLDTYIQQKTTITTSARVVLAKGVADALNYLHSEDVVHGDLHPRNVLMDDLGNTCLTDYGLVTVVETSELDDITVDLRWCAPEVIGTYPQDPERPSFKSDIYSFGGIMFLIVSGDIPWKEKNPYQICTQLSRRLTPARPDNILDNQWKLITKCWSRDPRHRPGSAEVLKRVISGGTSAQTRVALQDYRSQSASESDNTRARPGLAEVLDTTASPVVPRNVVIYGESGAGKSSLINLIAGRDIVETDPLDFFSRGDEICAPFDVVIGGECFRLWDRRATRGVPAAVVEGHLTSFLQRVDNEGGVRLLIYCMRGTRAVRALKTDYKIFSSVAREGNVPTAIVVTALEDNRPVMSEWWDRNKGQLTKHGMHPSAHACITTLKYDPAESPNIRQRRAQSYDDVCKLILDHCL